MRNVSTFRKSIIAVGVMMAVAAVPFSHAMAQDSTSSQDTANSSVNSSSHNQTGTGKVDDAWITTKVKSKLATTKHIKSTDISVNTSEGVVSLTGSVASAKQKHHVEQLAKGVKGVKSVDISGLTVGTTEDNKTEDNK